MKTEVLPPYNVVCATRKIHFFIEWQEKRGGRFILYKFISLSQRKIKVEVPMGSENQECIVYVPIPTTKYSCSTLLLNKHNRKITTSFSKVG